jgi:hypothetical protein
VANLIEYVLGLDIDAPHRRIVWRITQTGKHGLKNLRLGDFEVDLVCEAREKPEDPCRLAITAGGEFDLEVMAGERRLKARIQKGAQSIVVE